MPAALHRLHTPLGPGKLADCSSPHSRRQCKQPSPARPHPTDPPACLPACPLAAQLLEKDATWAAALAAGSPLLAAASAAKLSPSEAAGLADVCELLLMSLPQALAKGEPVLLM